EVVLHARHADRRAVLDVLLEALDVAVAVGALAQHDRRAIHGVDVRGVEERLPHHLQREFARLAQVADLRQLLDRPVTPLRGLGCGAAAPVRAPEPLPDLHAFGRGGPLLAPELEPAPARARWWRGLDGLRLGGPGVRGCDSPARQAQREPAERGAA